MTYLWRITNPHHAELQRRAHAVATTPLIERKRDGTVEIFLPVLQKLIDPLNTCLCPTCLLPEFQDQG